MFFSAAKTTQRVQHPLTGETLDPTPLFGELAGDVNDPRRALATWMTGDDNDYFPQVMVNRVWADLMGRGLVEPVDDLRATNPASNQPLLRELGNYFRDSGYDLKELLRLIANSRVYQLSSSPNESNRADTRNYSRHYRQRLRAEVLLDALADITGVEDKYAGMPPGSRANQIWTHRVGSVFLDTFGRPDPNQDPPCERNAEPTVTQTLHLMNSRELHRRIGSQNGRARQLATDKLSDQQLLEEIYLSIYCRFPQEEEQQVGLQHLDRHRDQRQQAVGGSCVGTDQYP